MQGSTKDPGIIPRVAERLLQLIKTREQEERKELGSLPYHSSWQLSALHTQLWFPCIAIVSHIVTRRVVCGALQREGVRPAPTQ